MRQINKRIMIACVAVLVLVAITLFVSKNTFAMQTSFFGEVEEDGTGCSVYNILIDIINTFTIGVGVIATAGIIAVGIMYMTARDNEAQISKAKNLFFNIVIGIITYVLFYAVIGLFLPGGFLNEAKPCDAPIQESDTTSSPGDSRNTSGGEKPSNSGATTPSGQTPVEAKTNSQKIALAAEKIAKQIDGRVYYCHKRWRGAKTKCTNCAGYATAVYQEVGLLPKNTYFAILGQDLQNSQDINKKKLNVHKYNQTISSLVKSGKVQSGDIVGLYSGHHTMIYKGKKNGKYLFYSLGRTSTPNGNQSDENNKAKLSAKKILNYKSSGSLRISYVISPKRNIVINYP